MSRPGSKKRRKARAIRQGRSGKTKRSTAQRRAKARRLQRKAARGGGA